MRCTCRDNQDVDQPMIDLAGTLWILERGKVLDRLFCRPHYSPFVNEGKAGMAHQTVKSVSPFHASPLLPPAPCTAHPTPAARSGSRQLLVARTRDARPAEVPTNRVAGTPQMRDQQPCRGHTRSLSDTAERFTGPRGTSSRPFQALCEAFWGVPRKENLPPP